MTALRLTVSAQPSALAPRGWVLTVERAEDVEILRAPEHPGCVHVTYATWGKTAECHYAGPEGYSFTAGRDLKIRHGFVMDETITLTVEPASDTPESPGPDPLTQARGNLREIQEELGQVHALAVRSQLLGEGIDPGAILDILGWPVEP